MRTRIDRLRELAKAKQQRQFKAKGCSRTEDSLIIEALVESLDFFQVNRVVEALQDDE